MWVGKYRFVNAVVGAQALWQLRVEADERKPDPPARWCGLGAKADIQAQGLLGYSRNRFALRMHSAGWLQHSLGWATGFKGMEMNSANSEMDSKTRREGPCRLRGVDISGWASASSQ